MLFVCIRSVAMTKRIFHAAAILSLILTAVSVSAGEVDATTVLGGALGGGAGAAVGSAVGGREGAIIGGGLGGALGAAIGSSAPDTRYRQPRPVVIEEPRYHHDNGLHLGHYKKYKSKHGRGDD
jgi:hypothetical protein